MFSRLGYQTRLDRSSGKTTGRRNGSCLKDLWHTIPYYLHINSLAMQFSIFPDFHLRCRFRLMVHGWCSSSHLLNQRFGRRIHHQLRHGEVVDGNDIWHKLLGTNLERMYFVRLDTVKFKLWMVFYNIQLRVVTTIRSCACPSLSFPRVLWNCCKEGTTTICYGALLLLKISNHWVLVRTEMPALSPFIDTISIAVSRLSRRLSLDFK